MYSKNIFSTSRNFNKFQKNNLKSEREIFNLILRAEFFDFSNKFERIVTGT